MSQSIITDLFFFFFFSSIYWFKKLDHNVPAEFPTSWTWLIVSLWHHLTRFSVPHVSWKLAVKSRAICTLIFDFSWREYSPGCAVYLPVHDIRGHTCLLIFLCVMLRMIHGVQWDQPGRSPMRPPPIFHYISQQPWWSLPRIIILLRAEKWWFSNFIILSTSISTLTIWLPWNIVQIWRRDTCLVLSLYLATFRVLRWGGGLSNCQKRPMRLLFSVATMNEWIFIYVMGFKPLQSLWCLCCPIFGQEKPLY